MTQYSAAVESNLEVYFNSTPSKEDTFEAFIQLETSQGKYIVEDLCRKRIADAKKIDHSLETGNLLGIVNSNAYTIARLTIPLHQIEDIGILEMLCMCILTRG